MNYSELSLYIEKNSFKYNIDSDYGCFAVWKDARPYLNEIESLLSEKFEILLKTEIQWSEKNFHENALRLYESPIYYGKFQKGHSEKIGDTKFLLFVVKDNNPNYTYAQSVSGKIEMSNLNIVKTKYEIRARVEKETSAKYSVHSTNNIHEFFYQAPLLLGLTIFEKLLKGENVIIDRIVKDLEGADGWNNYSELFKILNVTCNYLVQRGFEELPFNNPEKDIDFLTDNCQRLASALGAKQKESHFYKGFIFVNGEKISLDMRFVGDKYYDVQWQKDMLNNKVSRNYVFIPRVDDYFFSLLFHAKVQKSTVKEKYIGILQEIAHQNNFHWYSSDMLADNQLTGRMLKGYYRAQGYFYENPIDKGVFKNQEVIHFLPKLESPITKLKKIKQKIAKKMPISFKKIIKFFIK